MQNDIKGQASQHIYNPPLVGQFEINGQLSPGEFNRAGDHLIERELDVATFLEPQLQVKAPRRKKQYLVFKNALCKKRIHEEITEIIKTSDGGEEIVLLANNEQEATQEDIRFYSMYIIYDEHYFTPRMFFSATDIDGKPIGNELIKQDIQKEYIDKSLTIEPFNFLENVSMATVNPCKHAAVLKSMSDTMRQNGKQVECDISMIIFLKFIASVIPTVEFDNTGDLYFK